jgi:hypothetical protein
VGLQQLNGRSSPRNRGGTYISTQRVVQNDEKLASALTMGGCLLHPQSGALAPSRIQRAMLAIRLLGKMIIPVK